MFQIRDDEILACFPLSHVQDFNNHPLLIASDPLKNERLADMFREASGGAVAGDVFLLATVAFSEFVIGQCYDKRILRSLLLSLSRQATAQMIIDQNRKQDLLHNDDVAIVVVRVS
jgi:hypothetical protein